MKYQKFIQLSKWDVMETFGGRIFASVEVSKTRRRFLGSTISNRIQHSGHSWRVRQTGGEREKEQARATGMRRPWNNIVLLQYRIGSGVKLKNKRGSFPTFQAEAWTTRYVSEPGRSCSYILDEKGQISMLCGVDLLYSRNVWRRILQFRVFFSHFKNLLAVIYNSHQCQKTTKISAEDV